MGGLSTDSDADLRRPWSWATLERSDNSCKNTVRSTFPSMLSSVPQKSLGHGNLYPYLQTSKLELKGLLLSHTGINFAGSGLSHNPDFKTNCSTFGAQEMGPTKEAQSSRMGGLGSESRFLSLGLLLFLFFGYQCSQAAQPVQWNSRIFAKSFGTENQLPWRKWKKHHVALSFQQPFWNRKKKKLGFNFLVKPCQNLVMLLHFLVMSTN